MSSTSQEQYSPFLTVSACFKTDDWAPLFRLPITQLARLHCVNVGWLLHTAFCMTGTLGHLEKHVQTDDGKVSWVRVYNKDTVQDSKHYRYVAALDCKPRRRLLLMMIRLTSRLARRCITYRDIFPMNKTASVSSRSSTGARALPWTRRTLVSATPMLDQLDLANSP